MDVLCRVWRDMAVASARAARRARIAHEGQGLEPEAYSCISTYDATAPSRQRLRLAWNARSSSSAEMANIRDVIPFPRTPATRNTICEPRTPGRTLG